ncbi:hypothetical protein [Aeoliella sp. SH292]|uniref:hypothetical protein n=1 Tax=Aeoliella sp. SH292 TaxID=3454464 RepID=UPI003F9B8B7F
MKNITTTPPATDFYLRGTSIATAGLRVDREARVIRGITVLQAGRVNDNRELTIDGKTLAQVLQIGNTTTKGLKARWTHPNMSSDGLGTFLGRWFEFRMSADNQSVLADLHLSELAFAKPDPDLGMSRGEWLLRMADGEDDTFGVSLAPRTMDTKAMESEVDSEGVQPYRVLALAAIDIVDEPAATRGGLFGGQLSLADAPLAATKVLDQMFATATREVVEQRAKAFLSRYLDTRFGGAKPVELVQQKRPLGPATAAELSTIATNAGLDQSFAQQWASDNLTTLQAKAAICDMVLAKRRGESTGEHGSNTEKFRAEFRSQRATLATLGITDEESYIRSRVRDERDGLFI